jgi:hypothetical protein
MSRDTTVWCFGSRFAGRVPGWVAVVAGAGVDRRDEVQPGGFAEVVVGQIELADLGGDHGLDAGRQRRVLYGRRLVVGEVACLLLEGERIAVLVQGRGSGLPV